MIENITWPSILSAITFLGVLYMLIVHGHYVFSHYKSIFWSTVVAAITALLVIVLALPSLLPIEAVENGTLHKVVSEPTSLGLTSLISLIAEILCIGWITYQIIKEIVNKNK